MAAFSAEELWFGAIEALDDEVGVLDPRGIILQVNRGWRRFVAENGGVPETSIVGQSYLAACRTASPLARKALRGIEQVLAGKQDRLELEYPCHAPGKERWFLMRVSACGLPDGSRGAVVAHIDITERRRLERELQRLAFRDPLTGIANRRAFEREAKSALARAKRNPGGRLGILSLDLDAFKSVNDVFGHAEGDRVLRELGGVLARRTRQGDLAARVGGDEFAVLVQVARSAEDVDRAARRLVKPLAGRMAAIGHPECTVSVGVAVFPEDGATVPALREASDVALYQAKTIPGDAVVRFRPGSLG